MLFRSTHFFIFFDLLDFFGIKNTLIGCGRLEVFDDIFRFDALRIVHQTQVFLCNCSRIRLPINHVSTDMIVPSCVQNYFFFNAIVCKLRNAFLATSMSSTTRWVCEATIMSHCHHQLVEIILSKWLSRLKKKKNDYDFDEYIFLFEVLGDRRTWQLVEDQDPTSW